MNVYVAGKWEEKAAVRALQQRLVDLGHEITFDWTQTDESLPLTEQARRDLRGVDNAEAFFFIALKQLDYKGALAELGAALVLGLEVYVIGTGADKCIFTQHPGVVRCVSVAEALERFEEGRSELSTVRV